MATLKVTRRSSVALTVIRLGSAGDYAALDAHPHAGRGDSPHGDRTARIQYRFPRPKWPSSGRLVRCTGTFTVGATGAHDEFRGSNGRGEAFRITGEPSWSVPKTSDGQYTQQGSGDKYPGSSVTSTGSRTFAVPDREGRKASVDLTEMAGAWLPSRLKRANGSAGGGADWNGIQVRSVDEDNANRSFILDDVATIVFEFDTATKPSEPLIAGYTGQQADTSDPVVVASADGRTVEAEFAFRSADASDRCAKARLIARAPTADDEAPGTILGDTGMVVPRPGSGALRHRLTLTGLTRRTEFRLHVITTSQRGKVSDPSSLDDDLAHVRTATKPGAPRDVVVQPFTDGPHIGATLDTVDNDDYLTGARVVATFLPQGTLAWDSGTHEIGGTTRRADIPWQGSAIPDGQELSVIVYLRNRDMVWTDPSAPVRQTMRSTPPVTITPASGRLLSRTPTLTLHFPTADGARIVLVHETDDAIVLYDSGGTPLTNQTSHGFAIPADKLAYGQRFRAQGSYLPDGGTEYTELSSPVPYSIASLPSATLSVPDAVRGAVAVQDVVWRIDGVDPDGATPLEYDLELRDAASPQGTGALHRRQVVFSTSPTLPLIVVAGGSVPFESAVDARVRARNDISVLASTTLSGALSAGATTLTLASATGFAIGQDIRVASTDPGNHYEIRRIANLVSTTVTLDEPLDYAHASGQAVVAFAFGPWSPWLTMAAYEPPAVDLITPTDGATITRPWQTFDWQFTGKGGRTLAGSVWRLIDPASGEAVRTIDVGTDTQVDALPFLLEDATAYQWEAVCTDSAGLPRTSLRRSFTTAFAEPAAPLSVSAVADPGRSAVLVSLELPDDPDLHHVEVEWQRGDEWIRIDGGPEVLGDGLPAFAGSTLTHIGARLGDNAYRVRASNGWHGSDPVGAEAELVESRVRDWRQLVDEDGVIEFPVESHHVEPRDTTEVQVAPGAPTVVRKWGRSGATHRLSMDLVDVLDLWAVRDALDAMAQRTGPAWLKDRFGEPAWVEVTDVPEDRGPHPAQVSLQVTLEEVGSPVHAVLPEVLEAEAGVGDLYSTEAEYDWGETPVEEA